MLDMDDIKRRLAAVDERGWLTVLGGAVIGLLLAPEHRIIGAVLGGAVSLGVIVIGGPCCSECAGQPATSPKVPASAPVATFNPGGDGPGGIQAPDAEGYIAVEDVSSLWSSSPTESQPMTGRACA